ncbi:MAG: carboxypeptidase-like regulatory domain-containing protein [Bacillus subtilis]|nr:carboxypeptidase-like regulatory domain-containing protein [Bacillus subtilis]
MKQLLYTLSLSLILACMLLIPAFSQAGNGIISGQVTDENGRGLAGATIVIEGSNIGTIADANGNYQILSVPAGSHTVKISFVGYTDEEIKVEIIRGDVSVINKQMSVSSIEMVEVVVYGQARGQLAAINAQLNSKSISNVVSGEKLQELPDVNVAEAIGRLPGLMVERNRGEGQKIIIRGAGSKVQHSFDWRTYGAINICRRQKYGP